MAEYKIYDLTVSTLTPLHIGTGIDLLHEYDYAIRDGKTWRINEASLLDAQDVEDPRQADILARTPPARLLRDADFDEKSDFFRYVIKGTPRSSGEGAQLQEQIKDVQDRPYLPGSSLKGALRTAVAWVAWEQQGLKPQVDKLNRSSRFAAQNYERDIFGPNPNKDFMRVLHVADSAPVGTDRLMVLNVRALNRSGNLQAPIEVEAIRADTIFGMSLKLDLALYSEWAKKHGLHLKGKNFLDNLPQIVQAHTRQRIDAELAWYRNTPAAPRLASFYGQLKKLVADPKAMQFLLELGAGAGWDDKTFGDRLKGNAHFMGTILKSKREGGYGVARYKPPRNPQDFPTSRRVAVAFLQDGNGQIHEIPAYPPGWVLVEIKQR